MRGWTWKFLAICEHLKRPSPETHKRYFFRTNKRHLHFTELVAKLWNLKPKMFHVVYIHKTEEGRENSIGGKFITNWRETRSWRAICSQLWLLLMSYLNIFSGVHILWSFHYSVSYLPKFLKPGFNPGCCSAGKSTNVVSMSKTLSALRLTGKYT